MDHSCPCTPPGRKAAAVDPDLKAANLKHLNRIHGQVAGISRMVESDRYCADIVTQIAAVRESLHSVARNLLHNHMKHCAAAAARRGDSDQMLKELVDLVAKLAR